MSLPQLNQRPGKLRSSLPPALQYPAYRNYWLGMMGSVSGFQIFQITQNWLIFQLTDSPLWLGYVGVATALPGIIFNLFGGVFADRLDKRRVIIVAQALSAALLFLLATLTIMGEVNRWHVLIIAFLAGAVDAFNVPARMALYPQLIERKAMVSAVALNSSIWQGTRIIAPAIAGLIIGLTTDFTGAAASFYLAGLGFFIMAAIIYRLQIASVASVVRGNAGRNILEGLAFIRQNSIFSFLIGMTFFNSFFGISYILLLPVFAEDVLGKGAEGLGILYGIGGAGALLTNLWLGTRKNVGYRGLLIVGGGVFMGLALILFGVTSQLFHSFYLALAAVLIIGVFNTIYMNSVQSTLQMLVPDQMRGRVMGFYAMTWSIMPLGGMFLGGMTSLVNAPFAVGAGGLAVAAFSLVAGLLNKRLRNIGSELMQGDGPASTERQAASSTASD